MAHLLNKLLGREEESDSHSQSSNTKTESRTSASSGSEQGGRATDSRTVQHEGVSIKSTVSSDLNSTVSMANQKRLNDLVTKLGSTHTQIDEYAKKQTEKINDEIQRDIDQVLVRTRTRQEELLKRANEHTTVIDNEYRAQLQKMVEEIDAAKAKRIADIESELNNQQTAILQAARAEIDQLNQKAANLKIGVLQQAQAKAASDANDLTAQAASLGQTVTAHQAKGTTTITTEVSGVAKTKETGSTSATSHKECDSSCSSGSCATATYKDQSHASGGKTTSSESYTAESSRNQTNSKKN